jgi:signal transduction histidine kinase
MSDLVWSIDPGHDNFEDMLDRMKAFAVMMLSVREIDFAFETKGDFTGMVLPMQQRKNIFLIFKEAIYNITKYAECSMVSITFTHHRGGLQLIMKDNGKGFNTNELKSYNGNGLKNMKARTKEMNGEFNIESGPGRGTNLTLKMKL